MTPIASPASRVIPGGAAGQVLGKTANEDYAIGWIDAGTGGGGTGDVVGPAASTNGGLAVWNGTTGNLLQDSTKLVANVVTNPTAVTSGRIAAFSDATGKIIGQGTALAADVVAGPASATSGTVAAYSGATGKVITTTTKVAADLVTNAGASTDNAIARFDLATGKLIQDSGITIADGATGTLSGTNTGNQITSGTAPVVVATGSANPAISLSGTAAQFNATVTDADFATTAELAAKANLASPVFSGTVNGLFTGSASQALANFSVVSALPGSPLPNTIYFVTA